MWLGACGPACEGEGRGDPQRPVAQAHVPGPTIGAEGREASPPPSMDDLPRAWARERVLPADPPAALQEVGVYGAGHGRGGRDAGAVRVVLRFDRVAVFSRGEVAAGGGMPRRLFFDFEDAVAGEGVQPALEVGQAGLRRVAVAQRGASLRVAFDLEARAEVRPFVLGDPYRVVLDLGKASAPARPVAEPRARRTILLDPGHGGDDTGARFEDLKESHLALDITRMAARLVASRRPDVRVLMTRHGDDFVSLEQRTAMANAAEADLFVSVHLNAADGPVQRGGIATFVLDESNDEQALRYAARENGTSIEEVTQVQRVLAGLHRRGQVDASRQLARKVHEALLGRARQVVPDLPSRGVRDAMFYVLVGARMPAVLVEASFMTHPTEAEMLRTDRYRQALADGIAEGVLRYLADR
jgi:N-acetylmuramoyl-L-alanine amidase